MKNIIYILLSAMLLTITSCTDILDTPPTKDPSESIFWQSKSDFQSALAGCYNVMQGQTLSWSMPVYDCLTDNAYCNPTASQGLNTDLIQADRVDPSMTGLVPNLYEHAYAAIARINIFLSRFADYQGGDVADVREQWEGEVLFLRSYCYYMLYLFYGEVPYITKPLTVETQDQPKNTLNEVYTNLKSDLQTAIGKLNDVTYKESGGHVTKGAAKGLLARLLMFFPL